MALIKCKYCGHQMSDKAEQCPKCGKNSNAEYEPINTPKEEIGSSHKENKPKKYSVNKVIVSILVLVAICIGGIYGYYLRSNTSVDNEANLYEAEATTDSIETNEDLLKDGSYYWLHQSVIPIVYELKDGAIRNAYLQGIPLEAKNSHGEYFKGKNDRTLPNGQKMDLYVQFDLKSGEGYVQQGENRTNITMYRLCVPSDSVNNIIQYYKSNYEEAMRNIQSDEAVAEDEAVAFDSVAPADDYSY